MPALRNPLDVNTVNLDDPKQALEFYSAWTAASLKKSGPILVQMHKDGIIDENGRRISKEIPEVDADASVEQQ